MAALDRVGRTSARFVFLGGKRREVEVWDVCFREEENLGDAHIFRFGLAFHEDTTVSKDLGGLGTCISIT